MSPTSTAAAPRMARRVGATAPGEPACLLLAADPQRRSALQAAAKSAGWTVVSCDAVGDAVRQSQRWLTQLAAVDLGFVPEGARQGYRQFVEAIGKTDRLMLICDEPGCAESEVLARQAGAWMYLPSPRFDESLVGLFQQALQATSNAGAARSPATT